MRVGFPEHAEIRGKVRMRLVVGKVCLVTKEMGRQVNPFSDFDQFTQIHNVVFDRVIPSLSGNAVKVLLLLIRQTKGWQRDAVGMKIKKIQKHTGIGSNNTVSAALKELEDYSPSPLITVTRGSVYENFTYAINREFTISDYVPIDVMREDEDPTCSAKNESLRNAESAAVSDAKSESLRSAKTASPIRKEESSINKEKEKKGFSSPTRIVDLDKAQTDEIERLVRVGTGNEFIGTGGIIKRINEEVANILQSGIPIETVREFAKSLQGKKAPPLNFYYSNLAAWAATRTAGNVTQSVCPREPQYSDFTNPDPTLRLAEYSAAHDQWRVDGVQWQAENLR